MISFAFSLALAIDFYLFEYRITIWRLSKSGYLFEKNYDCEFICTFKSNFTEILSHEI